MDDKILGTIKKIRMSTCNKEMTTNNSKGFEKGSSKHHGH
jgi:hypothetical protein